MYLTALLGTTKRYSVSDNEDHDSVDLSKFFGDENFTINLLRDGFCNPITYSFLKAL